MTRDQVKALTVYLELSLVDRSMHSEYICLEYGSEDAFWDTLEGIQGVDLPYV